MSPRLILLCLFIFASTLPSRADTLKLTDGTTVDGRVIDNGDSYWIKLPDGTTRTIDKTTVASWDKSASAADASTPSASSSETFALAKSRADIAQTAVAAVAIWQSFLDSKPARADVAPAQAQLKHWQQLVAGNAEKINGKWIWGDDLKTLIRHVHELIEQGNEALRNNQTLDAIDKYQQAVALFPNNFEANFELGYFNLVQGVAAGRNNAKIEAGVRSLETAVKIRPDSAAALSDLAIGYNFRQQYELSVLTAYNAAKLEDSKEIVQNLVNSISQAPPGMRENNPKIKPIMQQAALLATKYGIGDGRGEWTWVRPEKASLARAGDDQDTQTTGQPGIFANGSGFFISPDGYILTNRHVAKAGDYLMVRLSDGTEKLAKRIVIDDEQDLAVIKIPLDTSAPYVHLASYDHPPTGADVFVFGFPLLGQFGLNSSVKMTRGIVTAWDKDQDYCDVTVDAQVNPGNSGGPMVDRHGNLLAITAMKTLAVDSAISSYGLGLSTGRLRAFFTKQQSKLSDINLTGGKEDGPELTNEDLAKNLIPATVCIFCCRGTPPQTQTTGD